MSESKRFKVSFSVFNGFDYVRTWEFINNTEDVSRCISIGSDPIGDIVINGLKVMPRHANANLLANRLIEIITYKLENQKLSVLSTIIRSEGSFMIGDARIEVMVSDYENEAEIKSEERDCASTFKAPNNMNNEQVYIQLSFSPLDPRRHPPWQQETVMPIGSFITVGSGSDSTFQIYHDNDNDNDKIDPFHAIIEVCSHDRLNLTNNAPKKSLLVNGELKEKATIGTGSVFFVGSTRIEVKFIGVNHIIDKVPPDSPQIPLLQTIKLRDGRLFKYEGIDLTMNDARRIFCSLTIEAQDFDADVFLRMIGENEA